MTPTILLFPSSYFSDSQPDEDLHQEYAAVHSTALFETVLFSYE